MLTLKIKTPAGEKIYETDDIIFGAFEEAVKITEAGGDLETAKSMFKIFQMFFPDLKEEEFKYLGMRQMQKFLLTDVKNFMAEMTKPVTEASKN